MMGIKAGRLAISQYFDQYQAGWQTALSQIYIAYMEMAERYCHIRRNFSFILYLAEWHFCFQILIQSGIGKIRASAIPEISDTFNLENETPDKSPILITGAQCIGHLCSPFTSKSVGWFCHLWDTCAQSTLAMIGRGSPGWHFTLFDRCNKVNKIRRLWSQSKWPWARLGRYFVPNKLYSGLRSWSFLWKLKLDFMSRK